MNSLQKNDYRHDIDGLRALAVIPVVWFHVGLPFLPGGFVGVDVFFVISGYLISGIIFREIREDRFSFARFYERRIRRILPALTAMITACLLMGYFVLFPTEYRTLSYSGIFGETSLANIYFYNTVNYFRGHNYVLLHVWSLAVEEQFYFIFPPILLLIQRKFSPYLLMTLTALFLFSLIASQWAVAHDASAAFYQPQYRFWELMCGGILAISGWQPPRSTILREGLAGFGLLLILGSLVFLNSATAFPGLAAVPVCAGTSLLIATASQTQGTMVSTLLRQYPVRLIGLASYSIYLWHWPLIVLSKEGAVFLPFSLPQDLKGKLLLALLSVALGFLSWRFIERPFRRSSRSAGSTRTLQVGALVVVAICAVAGVIVSSNGFPARFSSRADSLASFTDYDAAPLYRRGTCFIDSGYLLSSFDKNTCLPEAEGRPRILLLGDSHAAHLYPGLRYELPGAAIAQVTASGCRPLIKQPIQAVSRCVDLMNFALDGAIREFKPDKVIIAGNWTTSDLSALPATLAMLRTRTKELFLVGPVPHYSIDVPKLLAAAELRHDPQLLHNSLLLQYFAMDHEMAAMARAAKVNYLSAIDAMCDPSCVTYSDKQEPIQFDDSHLTLDGSRLLVRRWLNRTPSPL